MKHVLCVYELVGWSEHPELSNTVHWLKREDLLLRCAKSGEAMLVWSIIQTSRWHGSLLQFCECPSGGIEDEKLGLESMCAYMCKRLSLVEYNM